MRVLFFIPFIFIISCSTAVNLPTAAVEVKLMNSMNDFVTEISQAVTNKNQSKVMEMMHPSYVTEQHDGFLEGRTNQFLSEFFGSELNQINNFKHLSSYTVGADIFVIFETVSVKKKKSTHHYHVKFRNDTSAYKYGMVGVVG